MSAWQLVLAALVVTAGSAVQGAVGFGLNLLAVPLLLLVDADLVPGPTLVAGLVLSVLVAGREFDAMDRRLGFAYVGLLPGAIAGAAVVTVVPHDALSLLLGLLVLVAVALSALQWEPALRPS